MARISFDRAADFYDATRGLPPDVRDTLTGVLARELTGRAPCLEIGVGTGRIALGLHGRGIGLVGADVAPAMLRRLIANAGGRMPFPLLLADATRLPFRDASCGAVLASHVLHLIASWEETVEEVMRVLRPQGMLLVDFGGGTPAPWSGPAADAMRRQGVKKVRPGVTSPDRLARFLERRAELRRLEGLELTERTTLAHELDEWEHQIHAWTWPYSAGQMKAASDEVRRWAAREGWPLDREVDLARVIQWWAFERGG